MKILAKQNKFKAFFEVKFTEKEMRGLTEQEKELIRSNGYSRLFTQTNKGHLNNIVLFIEKDHLGIKRLYGMTKWQIIAPNKSDVAYMQGINNASVWFLPQKRNGYKFDSGAYEVRVFSPKSLGYLFGYTTELP
jgi:hypothetical protein|nr:MAG TPA: hypothetical protein [Caudoviricetes sp.]